jgi:hypothetical protein
MPLVCYIHYQTICYFRKNEMLFIQGNTVSTSPRPDLIKRLPARGFLMHHNQIPDSLITVNH